jgi:hypothetical protein
MKAVITITKHDMPMEVTPWPGDFVAWEERTGRSVSDWATKNPSYSDIAFLAYRAATRNMADPPEFQAWLNDGVSELAFAEVEANPTQSGQ